MAKSTWQRAKFKNPEGGMNAAGVKKYKEENPGSNLRTGVDKTPTTPEELRRQGSFRVRFYGQDPLPPLKKPNGEPTRLALANTAWNGPVVKTEAQARKIAEAGRKQLEKAKATKSPPKKK
jgi:hypothetical protein